MCSSDLDLNQAVSHALNRGATKSEAQYFDTSTVMFDPEGTHSV